MSRAEFFRRLGAPLANIRNSWGAVREDRTVFLAVWLDEVLKHDGKSFVRVAAHGKYADNLDNVRFRERLSQIETIKGGARCFLVMCIAKDVTKHPRDFDSLIDDAVFIGGSIIDLDGDEYIQFGARVPFRDVAAQQKS